MDEVTQQNAALVEQAAAAGSSLESQATDLKTAVSMFRLNASRDAEVRRPVAPTHTAAPVRARALTKPAMKRSAPEPVRVARTAGTGERDSL
jgi:methyl-accepting chemotaxis protein